ncbi:hypothetical protein [Blastococcus atacamensis]|uniref:hypothetical protein n=1 Tax=Blastococcus atacamensis TaxID=2070508 RepID=UPI000CECDD9E|nr:hypothetical protein [Blastococcus atacamensis]
MPAVLRPRRRARRPRRRAPVAEDAVRTAGDLVADGRRVDLALAGTVSDAVLVDLADRVTGAGIAAVSEVTLPARDRLPVVGVALALTGPVPDVDRVAARLPAARLLVDPTAPGAEGRCRALTGRRVRLTAGRGAGAGLAFVRCLAVLMAGEGDLAVATTDPRLIAITGERAAWNGRTSDSWEYVMPWGAPTEEQHRLVAAGHTVRVQVPVRGSRA